mmetsp:Transcript_74548/g.162983  ORF Transcript_74548/g.162983 Transcript_74548/m.162983 type:complete len:319 (-) Transcript_74548:24-980(-)
MPSVDIDGDGAMQELAHALKQRPKLRDELRSLLASDDFPKRRYVGIIKTFNLKNGYGFIDCPEVFQMTQWDVFLHKNQYNQQPLGSRVSFGINMNKDGQPQATDVETLDDDGYGKVDQAYQTPVGNAGTWQQPAAGGVEDLLTPEDVSQHFHCSICQEIFHRPTTIWPCLHVHCSSCLGRWLQTKRECPVCRAHVTAVKPAVWVDGLMNLLLRQRIKFDPERTGRCSELDGLDPLRRADYNLDKLPQSVRMPFPLDDEPDLAGPPWPAVLTPHMWDMPRRGSGQPSPSYPPRPAFAYSGPPAMPRTSQRTSEGWWYAS